MFFYEKLFVMLGVTMKASFLASGRGGRVAGFDVEHTLAVTVTVEVHGLQSFAVGTLQNFQFCFVEVLGLLKVFKASGGTSN